MEKNQTAISALILAIGFIASAVIGAVALKDIKTADRYVTVRGLAEKDMKADMAMWSLRVKSTGNELTAAHENLKMQQQKVKQFLLDKGFEEGEIQPIATQVFDRKAQQYGNDQYGTLERYILQGGLRVRSTKVDVVENIAQSTSDLVGQGITLGSDNACDSVPSYMFTLLNDVKPQMMADATKNAREAAEQFAKDAQAKVGTIRHATQGYFSIYPRDSLDGNGCGEQASVYKSVRVVTTVEYYLE